MAIHFQTVLINDINEGNEVTMVVEKVIRPYWAGCTWKQQW